MIGNTFILLFDYLVSTRIGNIVAVFLGVLIFYCMFRLVVKLIDYLVFKRLVNIILDTIYDEENEDYEQLPVFNHEDERGHKKDQKHDKIHEAERFRDMENKFKGKANFRGKKQIVGVSKPLGRWTAGVMKQWIKKNQNIDMNLINDLGYFRASVMNEKKSHGIDINR